MTEIYLHILRAWPINCTRTRTCRWPAKKTGVGGAAASPRGTRSLQMPGEEPPMDTGSDSGSGKGGGGVRVRADIIGHARINM